MKKNISLLLVLLAVGFGYAQNVISSSAYIQTCVQKTNCFSEINNAFLFYDENKEEVTLKIDFTNFRDDKDTIDHWLEDFSGSVFYYVAPLDKDEFTNLSNNSNKTVKLDGSIYFNDIWINVKTELVLFPASENGILAEKSNNNKYDNYRVNFGLSFMPKDFKVHKREHALNNIVTIGVAAGRINQLQPEMRNLLKDLNKK